MLLIHVIIVYCLQGSSLIVSSILSFIDLYLFLFFKSLLHMCGVLLYLLRILRQDVLFVIDLFFLFFFFFFYKLHSIFTLLLFLLNNLLFLFMLHVLLGKLVISCTQNVLFRWLLDGILVQQPFVQLSLEFFFKTHYFEVV